MIIVQLTGGMGNQMFQYAFGKHLAIKHKTILKLDLSFFKTYEWHEYSLGPFNIEENIASPREVKWFKGNYSSRYSQVLYNLKTKFFHVNRIVEPSLLFDPGFLSLPDDVYLEGYWQSEKYFEPVKETIKKEFTVKVNASHLNKSLLEKIIQHRQSVSIHIRRGNYASIPEVTKIHGLTPIDYYQAAMEMIESKIGQPFYFIFSDDIEWAKKHLIINSDHIFIDKNDDKTDYEDMRLMYHCKHQIIANSTFSWWAAWLNSDPHKIIIAPKRWFNDPSKINPDLLPREWITI